MKTNIIKKRKESKAKQRKGRNEERFQRGQAQMWTPYYRVLLESLNTFSTSLKQPGEVI